MNATQITQFNYAVDTALGRTICFGKTHFIQCTVYDVYWIKSSAYLTSAPPVCRNNLYLTRISFHYGIWINIFPDVSLWRCCLDRFGRSIPVQRGGAVFPRLRDIAIKWLGIRGFRENKLDFRIWQQFKNNKRIFKAIY